MPMAVLNFIGQLLENMYKNTISFTKLVVIHIQLNLFNNGEDVLQLIK